MTTPTPALPAAGDTPEARVRALADEVLADTDLFLVDVSVRGWKGSQVVEVFADREAEPGTGADLDALAEISRQLGFLLDTEDVMPGKYRLDVSSPGLDRPLTDPRQYRRHVGRDVALTLASGETLDGTLTDATPEAVTVQPTTGTGKKRVASGEPVTVAHADLTDARILLPW
ncbi:MAG: ribosome maturation factor RimP [Bacteroidota bacterium]